MTLNCNGTLLSLETPIVMGILNINEDSFYSASRVIEEDALIARASEMLDEGALILDIGAVSSRPGAKFVSEEIELDRILKAIKIIHHTFPSAIISVDTFRSHVAEKAIDAGASIINDITSGSFDLTMYSVLADKNIPYVMMHMQGTSETMQLDPNYEDVSIEVLTYFVKKIHLAKKAGIKDIIIDPGFGFGKTVDHNFQLLADLSSFSIFNTPILIGVSRKSMICKPLNINPKDALNGTTSLHMYGLLNGAKILRVHDVKEATQCIKLFNILTSKY
jgi:dihydropteroate synthase